MYNSQGYIILRLFLMIWIYFCILSCSDKSKKSSNTDIIGNVPHANDSSFVVFHKFLDSDATSYFRNYDSVPITDGYFKKTFKSPSTNVIVLASNEVIPSIHLIFDGKGKIGMQIKRSVPYFDVNFTGNNAMGHDLIFNSSLFRVIHLTSVLNRALGPNADSPQAVIARTEEILDSLVYPFYDLLKREQITPEFHERVRTQAEGKMLSAVSSIMTHAYNYPKTSTLKRVDIDKVLEYFFMKYDPFSERYRFNVGINRIVNAENKCRLIARGLLPGERKELDIWDDKSIQNAYAPIELQEKMMATQLILSRKYEENPICEDLRRFEKFRKTFPESEYNDVLQATHFDGLDCDGGNNELSKYPFASLKSDRLILIDEYQDNILDSLIRRRFEGKKVFVDLWATWCAPCIQEFGFIDELKPVLKELNIEALYVSLDSRRARKSWEKAIRRYRLKGSHFMVDKSIDTSLRAQLGEKREITIPRYLFFNERGRLLDGDMPRPSSGKLIDRLQELSNSEP